MAGMFGVGNILDAALGRKTSKQYASDPLQKQIDKSIGGMDAYRGDISRGLGEFESGMKENVAKQKGYEGMAESEIGQVQDEVLKGDYMADRDRIRSGDLSSLTGLLGQLGGGMSAADKTAAARLGYAGRPSGTYMDKARQSYIGAFASPLANTIYSGLNTGASAADAARRGKAGTVAGLIEERSKIPDRATDRMLSVPTARADFMGREIGALGGLGDVAKSNFMGFKEEKNPWAASFQAVDDSLNSAVDTGMSLYGMGGFGGFGRGASMDPAIGGGVGTDSERAGFWNKALSRRPNYIPTPAEARAPYATAGYNPNSGWDGSLGPDRWSISYGGR